MNKISKFQLLAALITYTTPLAFLMIPSMVSRFVLQNAWLAVLAGVIPGYLFVFMFTYIFSKSHYPFPKLLEEHLGKFAGGFLTFLYILFFLFIASFSLRLFTDFIETNVLPGTPISIHIGVMILAMMIGLRSGIENIFRLNEIIFMIGLPFAVIMVVLVSGQNINLENFLPVGRISWSSFLLGTATAGFVLGKLFVVLTFGFWLDDRKMLRCIMIRSIWFYTAVISLTTMAVIMALGAHVTTFMTFPAFTMITLINIAEFIQNIDIIFIGIWIPGIYMVTIISWFMTLYCTQQLLGLRDYRFLAAPSSLIIGILSIMLSRNILEVLVTAQIIIPLMEYVFFLIIPLLLILAILFKPAPAMEQETQDATTT